MGPLNLFHPKSLFRLFLAMAVLALALRLAGPYLVSPDRIEREVEAKVSAWVDAKLQYSGTPQVSFWPRPQVGFAQARLVAPALEGRPSAVLLSTEHIAVSFSLIGALFGAPDPAEIELMRPIIRLHRDESGALNWHKGARIEQALTAKGDGWRPAEAPPSFGAVVIRDGTVSVDDEKRSEHYRVTAVEGRFVWPAPSSDLDIALQGVIGGELVTWNLSVDEPMAFLDGKIAGVRTSLSADLLAVDFEGTANLSSNAFAAGSIRLDTPSFGRLLAWRGTDFRPADDVGRMTVEATIVTSGHTARLDNLSLGIEDTTATGVLDVSLPARGTQKIGGTLAFDRLDLRAMVEAYALAPGRSGEVSGVAPAAGDWIDLDLRLSSREASAAPLVLNEVAVGIRSFKGETSLDIGDAALLGGTLSGRIAVKERQPDPSRELQLSLRDVDLGALFRLSGVEGPLPGGKGSADVHLVAGGRGMARADISGGFRIDLDKGAIRSLERSAFERLAQGTSAFSLAEAGNGSFEFATAMIEGRIDHGLVELTRATFEGMEKTISLSGMIPANGSVALAGSLFTRTSPEASMSAPAINFLVGGAWPAPVITPMAYLTQQPAN